MPGQWAEDTRTRVRAGALRDDASDDHADLIANYHANRALERQDFRTNDPPDPCRAAVASARASPRTGEHAYARSDGSDPPCVQSADAIGQPTCAHRPDHTGHGPQHRGSCVLMAAAHRRRAARPLPPRVQCIMAYGLAVTGLNPGHCVRSSPTGSGGLTSANATPRENSGLDVHRRPHRPASTTGRRPVWHCPGECRWDTCEQRPHGHGALSLPTVCPRRHGRRRPRENRSTRHGSRYTPHRAAQRALGTTAGDHAPTPQPTRPLNHTTGMLVALGTLAVALTTMADARAHTRHRRVRRGAWSAERQCVASSSREPYSRSLRPTYGLGTCVASTSTLRQHPAAYRRAHRPLRN